MKLTTYLVLVMASLRFAECCPFCGPGSIKKIGLSDMRQLQCVKDSALPTNRDRFTMIFDEAELRWHCMELGPTDGEFENSAVYPATPEHQEDRHSYSFAHIGAGSQIVNCFESKGVLEETKFAASKGYFPVVHVKNGSKYFCISADKVQESLTERVARAFSNSCDEDEVEE